MTRSLVILLLLVSAAPLGAQETSKAPALKSGSYLDRVLNEGETLDYSLSWLRVIGGNARLTTRPVDGDGSRLKIRFVVQSSGFLNRVYPVRDEIESIVERGTFSTVRFRKILNERNRHKEELTLVDYDRGIAIRKGKEIPVARPLFDPLSVIGHIRRFELVVGKTLYFTVLADGKIYPLEANVVSKETIDTPGGTFRTVVVEPKMRHGGIFGGDEDNRLIIWYSDDDRHIPVRIRTEISAGSLTASLKSAVVGEP